MIPSIHAGRLSAFLAAAHGQLRLPLPKTTDTQKLDPATLYTQLNLLHTGLNLARNRGLGFNPWTVAGLRRSEIRACGVLAELLNPAKCGDAAVRLLREFMGELRCPLELPTTNEMVQPYVVRTEHSLLGDRTTRMDITVEGESFVLMIEAKIGAPEGKGEDNGARQFALVHQRLKKYAQQRGEKRALFVVISPRRPKAGFEGIYADWHAVARAARRCLPRKRSSYSFQDLLLAGFADHADRY
jgi:hypothetical protein